MNVNNDTKIIFQSKNNIKIISNRETKSSNKLINGKTQFKALKDNNLSSKGIKNYEEKLDNYELNNLEYKEAIKLDKRKIIENQIKNAFDSCNINLDEKEIDKMIYYIKNKKIKTEEEQNEDNEEKEENEELKKKNN